MHKIVGYLISKPEDFKNCTRCGSFNWYERQQCVNCGHELFRKTTRADIEAYVNARSRDEHFCDECEIDV